jgi:Gly-Xaa carboxypeptidase
MGVHRKLEVSVINKHALLFHWQGSDDSLKPILISAHQDVVPVDDKTTSRWEYPPWSGKIVDEYIWGRGTLDHKVRICWADVNNSSSQCPK